MGTRPQSERLVALLAAILAMAASPSAAQQGGPLRLVFSDPYAVVFMSPEGSARSASTDAVEVTHWTFFDRADRLTASWGWNTRVSRERIDCGARRMAAVQHQTYLDGSPVSDSRPPVTMRAPVGADKAAILAYVCAGEAAMPEVIVKDVTDARAWADTAYAAGR